MPGRPHTSLGFYRDVSPRSPGSVAGSATSLCSSPPIAQVDASASEPGPAAPYSPMAHLSAREQLSAVLPPKGNMLRPSESLLRYLRRTDSADHAQEMQALQQVPPPPPLFLLHPLIFLSLEVEQSACVFWHAWLLLKSFGGDRVESQQLCSVFEVQA